MSFTQAITLIVTASGAITAGAALWGVLRHDKKLDEIHVLVNANLTAMQTRNEQLARLLIENQVELPPLPDDLDGKDFPKKVT